jgi:DMSO reductase family type II enzyme heme b subunit
MAQPKYNSRSLSINGIFLILFLCFSIVLFEIALYDRIVSEAAAAEIEEEKTEGESQECTGDECKSKEGDKEELTEEQKKGKKLYMNLCAPCHGHKGDGKGFARSFTFPRARDFTTGKFKFRSTPSGQPPTDEDLIRVTKKGNPGTTMPAYGEQLSDDETMLIINFIKEKLAPEAFKIKPTPYEIGDPPDSNPEIINLGREIYEKGGCVSCHGRYARGDGEFGWEEDMKDDWGDRIYPSDLTHPWELRNYASVKDLYRAIITGLDGTPMTSYKDEYSEDELWALAHYLKSIQLKRVTIDPLEVRKVNKIPVSVDDDLWDDIQSTDLRVKRKKSFGQTRPSRISNVRLRAVHTGSEIAFMLEWHDKKPDKGDKKLPPDAVGISFPSVIVSTDPWIDKGDRRTLIDVWKWNAADDRASEAFRKGSQETKKERANVRTVSSYKDGLYRIIFIRDKTAAGSGDILFNTGKEIFYSVIVNDGDNLERGNSGGKSMHNKLILK